MDFFILNILNAMQLSMLIFILAIGLTLIFGLMDTLNLAHGGFYTIGAYAGSQLAINGSFWLAFLVSPLVAGIAGAILQRFALQPLASKGRSTHLDFALFTFGLLFVIMGGAEIIFGSAYLSIDAPAILKGGFAISGVTFPYYRVFVIFLGLTCGGVLWLLIDRTVLGAVVRAGVADRETVCTLGIDINRVFVVVFALGCAFAGLAGVVSAPIFGIYSHMGASILVVTLIVVVVGGLGSFKGSFWASIIVGTFETMAQAYAPDVQLYGLYILLALILAVKPEGLFAIQRRIA
jgi:branched-chain amino acid transport system permease protein